MSAGYEAYEAMSDAERVDHLWKWLDRETRRAETAEAEVRALTARLDAIAGTFDAMLDCHACVEWAAKGLPFCNSHAVTLGGYLGEYIDRAATTDPTPETETP